MHTALHLSSKGLVEKPPETAVLRVADVISRSSREGPQAENCDWSHCSLLLVYCTLLLETADRVLIEVGCDQTYRAVDKCFVAGTVDKAIVHAVKGLSHKLKSEAVRKLEKDTEERSGFVMHHTTPFVHFHGFTWVADHRDTYKFVDGPIDIIPEMFTNLAPPTQTMMHFNQVPGLPYSS